jgi:hypothetical protein
MAKVKKPTKAQRARLAETLILKKRCEALGIEWDSGLLKDGEWSLDEKRYTDLEMKMAEALFTRLGVNLGSRDDMVEMLLRVQSDRPVTVDELIDIGKRAGWI